MMKLSKGMKASVAFFFASMFHSAISYLTTPFFTRILSEDEFGIFSLFQTWMQIFGVVAMFCLFYGVFNNGMLDYEDHRDEYSFSMLCLSNLITVIFSAILIVAYPLYRAYVGLEFPLILLMCVTFLFQPAYRFWAARQRYELKYKMLIITTIITSVFSPLCAIVCIRLFPGNRLYARLFGSEVFMIVFYAVFCIILAKKSRFRIKTSYWKEAFLFNLPLIPHYLSTYLLNNSDKTMIAALIGNRQTAYYTVAYSVAAVATIAWGAVNSSLLPFSYEKCKTRDYKSLNAVTIPLITAFAVFCVLIIMFAPEAVAIMATAHYHEAIFVIPPVVGGVFFQVQYFLYSNILYYHKKPVFVMVASLTATALNIVLNYIFIPQYGYLAAGYTTLLCYMVQAVLDYIMMRLVIKEPVYNMTYIIFLSALVTVIALVSNLLYDNPIARYTIIALIGVTAVLLRKKLVELFKTLVHR